MRLTRVLAFHEHHVCRRGHLLDVWVLPRAPGDGAELLRTCPGCGTLFLLGAAATPSTSRRPFDEPRDDACPRCGAALDLGAPEPTPRCRECRAVLRSWLTDGSGLPASAASMVRCWAVSPVSLDLREKEHHAVLPEARRSPQPQDA